MPALSTLDAVYIAALFIVPGYVLLSTRQLFLGMTKKLGPDDMLAYLTISGLNFALFGWLIYLPYAYNANGAVRSICWMICLVVVPFIFGVILAKCGDHQVFRRACNRFGFKPLHPIPGSWDYKFSQSPGEWLLVTLKCGTRFAGWWSGNSFASSDPKERDLFIEAVYEVAENGPWKPTGKSVLIVAGEIRTIEFIPVEATKGDHNHG
jgi:hypothetical protein